jgi:hypothetical protein
MSNLDQFILETIILAGLFIYYTIGMITMLYIEAYRVNKGKDRFTAIEFIINALNWPIVGYKEWKNRRI